VVTDPADATALIWTGKSVDDLMRLLHDGLDWVQLPDAGVERWLAAGILDGRWTVTSARGCFGPQVAEHAVALLLAGFRRLQFAARANSWPEDRVWGTTLRGRDVVILGGGDVGRHLVRMLVPFGATTTVITRRGLPVPDATRTLPVERLHEGLTDAAALVVAAPATPETRHLIGERELRLLRPGAVLVNVARGSLVDPVALLAALDSGQLSAAALDVTEPEPLPVGHPLWEHPKVLITPHVANPPETKEQGLAELVRENTLRFVNRQELLAVVDPTRGY
jgi:D-3-phosphoglycerate dehydrogenase